MIKRTNTFHCEITCDRCNENIFNEDLREPGPNDHREIPATPIHCEADLGKRHALDDSFDLCGGCMYKVIAALNDVLPSAYWSGPGERHLLLLVAETGFEVARWRSERKASTLDRRK